MLRIDIDSAPDQGKAYHVPQDNPFIGQAVWPEIYAYGFRNPWACSWDSNTLICGDVGQDLVEEIKYVRTHQSLSADPLYSIVKPGKDYGWENWEGRMPTKDNAANTTTTGMSAGK